MTSSDSIKPVSPEQVSEAIELFQSSGRKSDWEKLFGSMLAESLNDTEFLVLERSGQIDGAVLAIVGENSADVLAPVCHADVSASDQSPQDEALLQALCENLRRREVRFATCVVGPSDRYDKALVRSGFRFAANVQSMVRPISGDERPKPLDGLDFLPIDNGATLANLITETYRGSLDCPIVNDYRSAEELLACYANASTERGESEQQDGWFVARHGDTDVGCILISCTGKQAEVVYFGIIPSSRGKGFGQSLLDFAHHYVQQRAVVTITADVDSKNTFAIPIYENAGYIAFAFNRVFITSLD